MQGLLNIVRKSFLKTDERMQKSNNSSNKIVIGKIAIDMTSLLLYSYNEKRTNGLSFILFNINKRSKLN